MSPTDLDVKWAVPLFANDEEGNTVSLFESGLMKFQVIPINSLEKPVTSRQTFPT